METYEQNLFLLPGLALNTLKIYYPFRSIILVTILLLCIKMPDRTLLEWSKITLKKSVFSLWSPELNPIEGL